MPAAGGYAFGSDRLEARPLPTFREGPLAGLSPRHFAIPHAHVSRAGEIQVQDRLLTTGRREAVLL
jgi:hypothetical protein